MNYEKPPQRPPPCTGYLFLQTTLSNSRRRSIAKSPSEIEHGHFLTDYISHVIRFFGPPENHLLYWAPMIYATWNYVSRQINSHNPIVFAPVFEINMCVCLIGESHDSSMHLHFIFLYFCILDCWLLLSEYASWILLTWQVQGSVHCLTGNEDDPDTFTTMKEMMPMMMIMFVMMLTMMMAHMAMKSMSALVITS